MKDAWFPRARKGFGVIRHRITAAASLNAKLLYLLIVAEIVESSYRIAAAADTSNHIVGKSTGLFLDLLANFFPDDLLKIANNSRIRMGPNR